MSEAVLLALIAILGVVLFSASGIIQLILIRKSKPSLFEFCTRFGRITLKYDCNDSDTDREQCLDG